MATLEEAKQQVQTAKQQVAQRREQIIQTQEKLRIAETKLPQVTARSLRQGAMAGLKGRNIRRVIEQAREKIGASRRGLQDYGSQLTAYEQEQLNPVEENIKSYETQASSNQRIVDAYTASVKKVGVGSISGLIIKRYNLNPQEEQKYRDLVNSQGRGAISMAQQQQTNIDNLSGIIEKYNVGDDLSSQERLKLSNYEKAGVVKFESVIPEIKTDLQSISSKIEDRTERNNFNQFFSGGGIPSVSASNYSESIKKKDGSLGNESYVGTGGDTGSNVLVSKDTSIRNFSFGNFSDFGKSFKQKNRPSEKESYDPRSGMFVSASPTGPESTAYLRPAMEGEVKITYPILSKLYGASQIGVSKLKTGLGVIKDFSQPIIKDIKVRNNKIRVSSSPVKIINFIAPRSSGERFTSIKAGTICEAEYKIKPADIYVRIECIDFNGKYAISNPVIFSAGRKK